MPRLLPLSALAVIALLWSPAADAQPVVTGVFSRMTHGGQGGQIFDLPMPQIAPYGVECRTVANGLSVVVTFDRQVTAGNAAVVAGTAALAATDGVVVAGNSLAVNLTGVANAQQLAIRLTNVADAVGGTLATRDVYLRILYGDCNASGSVTVGDLNYAKFYDPTSTGGLNYGNCRADVNVSGTISLADVNVVKAQINTKVGVGPQPNTAPVMTNITDQSTPAGTPTSTFNFTVADNESPPENLYVSATSSDQTIVPNANIALGGAGANRTIAVTPAPDRTGTVTITVTVSDGLGTTTDTFLLTAGQAQKLYVAMLRPTDANTVTSASGVATLLVSGDQSSAVLRVTYQNLSTNKTASHVHFGDASVANGPIIFDIDNPPANSLQPDGSYVWTITKSANITVAQIQDAIASGSTYLNVHTTKYPDGEIRGQFNFASGSQTFTKPDPAPALLPSDLDLASEPAATRNAVRFLAQSTFGATNGDGTAPADIAHLKSLGSYDAWLDEQFAKPPTSFIGILTRRITSSNPVYPLAASNVQEIWWATALGGTDFTDPVTPGVRIGDDQLRQRVAFALSELFVVSRVEETIANQPLGLASYHDTLANNAFGNFRTLLREVTLHPIMGQYLNMRGNKKKTTATSPDPNENYAREVLQLFSIGLNQLHPDGTLKLDGSGLPMPTYDQSTIQNFARVFTGWDLNQTPNYYDYWDPATMTVKVGNSTNNAASSRYIKPMVATANNHDTGQKTLLRGVVIPPGATADNELNAALDNIFNDPNVGPFIARRLIQRLVTSNPSPAYIWRVARAFDGYRSYGETTPSAAKGDLKETLRAVLTDYEARSGTQIGNQGFGKIKEPILRLAQVIRAFHANSNTTTNALWRMPATDTDLGQTPYRSPTVFNFFEPDYTIVQNLVKGNGQPYTLPLNAPEMQIVTENTSIYMINMLKRGIIDNNGFSNSSGTNYDVRIDLTTERAITTVGIPNVVDHLNNLLLAGQMPSFGGGMRDQIINYVTSGARIGDVDERTRVAAYLVAASPQMGVQK